MSLAQTLLKIRLDQEVYGVDSDMVDQILRVSPITPIPLASSALRGVSVIAGKVVNVLDLKTLLGMDACNEKSETARLLTIKSDEELLGFLVDEVLDTISTDRQNFEENTNNKETVEGFYKDEEHIVQIISPLNCLKEEMLDSFQSQKVDTVAQKDTAAISDNRDEESLKRCLFFYAGGEKFAIDLELLRELIFVPESITALAEASHESMGVVTLRNELINALDFNKILGFEACSLDSKNRFLIAQNEQRNIALCVDEVEEVKDLVSTQLETLSSTFQDTKIEALYKDDDGSIVSIVADHFLKNIIVSNSINEQNDTNESKKDKEQEQMSEIAVFAISNEEFALDIEDVQEIIRYEETTPIPEAPDFVEGVINLRGSVIPVVSLPERLGFEKELTEKSKIVVCMIKDEKIGFLVDDVNEILFVQDSFIATNKSEESLIKETISLDEGKRVILKLRINYLFSNESLEEILAVNG